jgi:hypothetical protein
MMITISRVRPTLTRAAVCAAFTLLIPAAASAQDEPARAKTETLVLARTATDQGTYHFAEVLQTRGRWIVPDVGYIDFNHASEYREFFAGIGRIVAQGGRLTLWETAYVAKSGGTASGGALYLQPYTLAAYRLTEKITADAVYFPYIPLDREGHVQHVFQRAKIERDFAHVKVGVGYGANKPAVGPWRHKPFATTTIKIGRGGSVELWLQRLPDHEATLQVRYAKWFR